MSCICKRTVLVVSACMTHDGLPKFALNEVEVTQEEHENGVHYALVEERLAAAGYEEPFVHFADEEAPSFLVAGLTEYLAERWKLPQPITELSEEP